MTAPALRSSSKFADSANATSRTIAKPTGATSGDWFFLLVSIDGTATITQPTGFTTVFDQIEPAGTNMRLACYKRKCDGSEGSTFTVATSSEIAAGICACISGADSTEALDAMSIWGGELNAVRSPGVLPTGEAYAACSDGSLVIQCAAFDNGSGTSFTTTPSGYTEIETAGANSSGTHMRAQYKTMASQGYVGANSWTYSNDIEQGWALTLVIRASANTSFPAQPVIRCMNTLHMPTAAATTLLKPYGTVDNDLLILAQSSRTASGTGLTPPAGFTQIQADSDGASISHQAHYRVASSEGSSYTVSNSSQDSLLTAMMRIVGAATSSPIDTSSVAKGTSATPTASTITPSVNNCLILYTEGNDDDEVVTGGGTPSGMSNVYSEANDTGTDCSIIIARAEQTTATATGSLAGSFTASEDWVAIAMAIKPVGGPTTYNDTISESVTLNDSLAAALTCVAALSEGITLTDSLVGGLLLTGTVSESITPGDSVNAITIFNPALSEPITLTDSNGVVTVLNPSLLESITPSDVMAAAATMNTAFSEGITLLVVYDTDASPGNNRIYRWPLCAKRPIIYQEPTT